MLTEEHSKAAADQDPMSGGRLYYKIKQPSQAHHYCWFVFIWGGAGFTTGPGSKVSVRSLIVAGRAWLPKGC